MVKKPLELTLMTFHHLSFGIHLVGDVNVNLGNESYTRSRLHKVYRNSACGCTRFAGVMRNSRREACRENKLIGSRVVGHIVVRIVSNDEIGIGISDNLDYLVNRLSVVLKNIKVVEAAPDNLGARDLACLFSLASAYLAKLLGHDLNVSQVAVRQMTAEHLVAAFNTLRDSTAAFDLNIVGVRSDKQNSHISKASLLFIFMFLPYCITNRLLLQYLTIHKKGKIIYLTNTM